MKQQQREQLSQRNIASIPQTYYSSLTSLSLDGTIYQRMSSDKWRCYGKERRRYLLESDLTEFRINIACHIQKYFALAERVMQQFRTLCNTPNANAENVYVLGHRLINFFSQALPHHPDFYATSQMPGRQRIEIATVEVQALLPSLALRIDEEQLNLYMEHEYEPRLEEDDEDNNRKNDDESGINNDYADESSASSFDRNMTPKTHCWEAFEGWSFDVPGLADTDESSFDDDLEQSGESSASYWLHTFEYDDPGLDNVSLDSIDCNSDDENDRNGDKCLILKQRPDPPALNFHGHCRIELYALTESVNIAKNNLYNNSDDSSFLRQIAEQEVQYETDSEADDSWAQSESTNSQVTLMDRDSSVLLKWGSVQLFFAENMNHNDAMLRSMDADVDTPPPPPRNSPEGEWTASKLGLSSSARQIHAGQNNKRY